MDPNCTASLCSHSTGLVILKLVGLLLIVGVAAFGGILLLRISKLGQEIVQEKITSRLEEQ